MSRLGIIVNTQKPEVEQTLATIQTWATDHDWPVVAVEHIHIDTDHSYVGVPKDKFEQGIDFLIALGGDGTILSAVRVAAPLKVPVMGINLGGLGFLTVASPTGTDRALDRLRTGDFQVEQRHMLDVWEGDGESERWSGLNDVVVDKGGIARTATFHVSLNGESVSAYVGDGLIVATPTGSTAYSLSVGGPIMMPTLDAFVLTPISPHSLAQRPIVFGSNDRVGVTVQSVAGSVLLTVDGQRARELSEGTRVTIAKSPHVARLVHFSDYSFLRVLHEKLHWGFGRKPGDSS